MDNNNNLEIVVPERLKGMKIVATVFNQLIEEIGFLIMGENLEEATHEIVIIRIYQIIIQEGKFQFDKELEAFAFEKSEDALDFVKKLPKMSALEMLLMLNGFDRLREKGDDLFH